MSNFVHNGDSIQTVNSKTGVQLTGASGVPPGQDVQDALVLLEARARRSTSEQAEVTGEMEDDYLMAMLHKLSHDTC